MIAAERNEALLREVRDLFTRGPSGLCRPLRGHRADAPPTALIMAINNRLATLARERAADEIVPGPNWLAIREGSTS